MKFIRHNARRLRRSRAALARAPHRFAHALLLTTLLLDASFAATPMEKTQTASARGVTVKVTYLDQTEHESRFSVALDTHSVNLDSFDFKASSILRDDTGISLRPTGIESKGSGHHRESILTFTRPSAKRTWLELVVKDLAGEPERVFRWQR